MGKLTVQFVNDSGGEHCLGTVLAEAESRLQALGKSSEVKALRRRRARWQHITNSLYIDACSAGRDQETKELQ